MILVRVGYHGSIYAQLFLQQATPLYRAPAILPRHPADPLTIRLGSQRRQPLRVQLLPLPQLLANQRAGDFQNEIVLTAIIVAHLTLRGAHWRAPRIYCRMPGVANSGHWVILIVLLGFLENFLCTLLLFVADLLIFMLALEALNLLLQLLDLLQSW